MQNAKQVTRCIAHNFPRPQYRQKPLCTRAMPCIGEACLDAQHDGVQWQGGVLKGQKALEVVATGKGDNSWHRAAVPGTGQGHGWGRGTSELKRAVHGRHWERSRGFRQINYILHAKWVE